MRGERYHHLLEDSRLAGPAKTAPRYTLVDLGDYPALLEGGEDAVAGEVFVVARRLVPVLDELEGHPEYYRRALIELEGGVRVTGYLFVERTVLAPRVAGGSWRDRRR